MAEPAGDPLTGVLIFAAVAVAPTALFWLALRLPPLVRGLRERRRPPAPSGPPVERIAADLRRVRHALRTLPAGVSAVRRRGIEAAYEDLLTQACRALAVEHQLAALPPGLEREVERLRIELALQTAGLEIR